MHVGKISRMMFSTLVLAGSLLVGTGAEAARVYVRVGPPVAVREVRTVAPGPRYVWVPGYHVWNGSAYTWTAGAWRMPPRGRKTWVQGRWVKERHGWYFVEGRWR